MGGWASPKPDSWYYQIDIETFEKMEQLLEDYALGQLIEQNDPADNFTIREAKEYYRSLNK